MCIGTAEDVFFFSGADLQLRHAQQSRFALKQAS